MSSSHFLLVFVAVLLVQSIAFATLQSGSSIAASRSVHTRTSMSIDSFSENSLLPTATRVVKDDQTSNPWNKLSFAWTANLIRIGNRKALDLEDLWGLPANESMNIVSDKYDILLSREYARSRERMMGTPLHTSISNATTATHTATEIKPAPAKSSALLLDYWRSPIIKALVKMYQRPLMISGVLKFFNTCVQFIPSLIIARILQNVDLQKDLSTTLTLGNMVFLQQKGVMLCMALFIVLSTKTFIENQYFYRVINLSSSVKGALSSAIYKKAMKLSPSGRTNNTVGEVVNYMQIDSSRIEQVAGTIHTLWDGYFQVIGYTALLLRFLGVSVFAGIATMIIIIPLNAHFLKKLSTLRAKNLKMTDARVKLTNEIFQGMKAIKSYNWEKPFLERLLELRNEEVKSLRACANTRAILVSMLSASPSIVSAVVLAIYSLLGNELTPVKVFTALALFNQLRFPLIFLPMLLNNLTEGMVSLKRLEGFFDADEVENYVDSIADDDYSGYSIRVQNGDFTWSKKESNTHLHIKEVVGIDDEEGDTKGEVGRLRNVNVEIGEKKLVAVVGPVGAGKTTLMSALLGELNKMEGNVAIKGRVAYVSQSVWIPNDSLRNVILFGKPYEGQRYNDVIEKCSLRKDLDLLDAGDLTEIGERAINLSGGQRQRLNLARAVYDDADIYLLDDPLSALDAEVGSAVFENCIKGSLKDKTRLLVTHQLNLLTEVDSIIVMGNTKEGECSIVDQGTYSELTSRGHDFSKMVRKEKVNEDAEDGSLSSSSFNARNIIPNTTALSSVSGDISEELGHISVSQETVNEKPKDLVHSEPFDTECVEDSLFTQSALFGNNEQVGDTITPVTTTSKDFSSDKESVKTHTAGAKLMTDEERAVGTVSLDVYRWYLKAANKPLLFLMILLSFVGANASQQLQQFVTAAWTSDIGYKKRPLGVYLGGVSLMAFGVAFFNWSRTYVGCMLGTVASQEIHSKMAKSVLCAPLSFFETTPMGRLLQRFTKDLDQIDQQLPSSFGQFVASTLNIISAMVAIMFVTPSFGFVLLPILVLYASITNFYRNTARELKRIDSISRSPVYAHFSESLEGITIIRSYLRQKLFQRKNEIKLEDNISAYFSLKAVDRWLSVRLELLGNVIVFLSAMLVTLTQSRAGSSGLSLNNALGVTGLLNWAVRNGAELEAYMNSVERVQYTTFETPHEMMRVAEKRQQHIQEESLTILHTQKETGIEANLSEEDTELLQSGWPWQGGIVFNNVHMRYRDDLDYVLRGVDLKIQPGEMIGVVGRTGSGKSSLFRALLRLNEANMGSITVDGKDLSKVSLDVLRSSIGVIPQDPVLFSGTIRKNLDPYDQETDETIWEILRRSNMESSVRNLPGALQYEVREGGENFSLGQRQLLW